MMSEPESTNTVMQPITAEALDDVNAMLASLKASAAAMATTHIPTMQARSDRLLSSAAIQQAVYASGVDDVIGELVRQQGKVGAAMQRGVVPAGTVMPPEQCRMALLMHCILPQLATPRHSCCTCHCCWGSGGRRLTAAVAAAATAAPAAATAMAATSVVAPLVWTAG